MNKVVIELDVDPAAFDANHETGLTEEAYMELNDSLTCIGDVIDIRKGDS